MSTFVCYILVTIPERVSTIPAWKEWRTTFARISITAIVSLALLGTAQADTITQTKSTGVLVGIPVPTPTAFTFNTFNPSLGILTEVRFALHLGFSYSFTVSPASGTGTVVPHENALLTDNSGSAFGTTGVTAGQSSSDSFGGAFGYSISSGVGGPDGLAFTSAQALLVPYEPSAVTTFMAMVTFDPIT